MKAKRVGLYLGVNSAGAAVARGKKVLSLSKFELSSVEDTSVGALKEDIRWEALINRTLREVGADTKNVYISLADRDFIFRPLELPLMNKHEIESSLVYEMGKYIPFKMEELEWDYDFIRFPKEKKITLSFIGIRESNFRRVKDILSHLELKAVTIEPSCLSLARLVRASKKFSQFKNFAILDFTRAESYLTFFQQDLPIFNRYLTIPKKEETFDLDKFIESVNFSFQYFKREFKTYELERFIIIGDSDIEDLASSLKEELQAEIDVLSPFDLTQRNDAQVEGLKALGAAETGYSAYKFRPQLLKTEERLTISGEPLTGTALRTGLLSLLAGAGLVVSIFFSVFLGNDIALKKVSLQKKEERMVIPPEFGEFSWQIRRESVSLERDKIKSLEKIQGSFIKLSDFFEKLGSRKILPSGLWLDKLEISRRADGYTANLSGYIFRDDDYEERLSLDEFISSLKRAQAVRSVFSSVELKFSDKKEKQGFEVTHFSINLQ